MELNERLLVGIHVSENLDITIGSDNNEETSHILNVDSSCYFFRTSRIDHVDFFNNQFVPEREVSTDLLILIRDQTPDNGYWRLYHRDDPMCQEPHGEMCFRCRNREKPTKYGCQCQCFYCKNRLNVSGKRVSHYPIDILVGGYQEPESRRIYHRRGYECLVKVPLGSGLRVEKHSRAWEKNKHVLIEHLEGCVKTTRYLNYRDCENTPVYTNL